MSSNVRSIPNIIPPKICGALFPGPGLSVSQFMDFLLPNISPNSVTNSVNITDYLSESTPDLNLDQKLLQDLPLPCRAVLEKRHEHLGHLPDLCQQKYRSVHVIPDVLASCVCNFYHKKGKTVHETWQ